jgi:Flp pilus assembly protein TadD
VSEQQHAYHLQAADAWLRLGNPAEALAALNELPPDARRLPDALEIEWTILARKKRWNECLQTAEALLAAAPKRASSWIDRSYTLHELGRTREALEALLQAVEMFPKHVTIHYNLACYTCQLGDHEAARRWLTRALVLGDAESVKRAALADLDLQPMRAVIEKL